MTVYIKGEWGGVLVTMSACHSGDLQFKSQRIYFLNTLMWGMMKSSAIMFKWS